MSKIIKLTPDIFEEIRNGFNKYLASEKFTDGKVSYQYNIANIDRKANLIFAELAWLKMNALVQEFSTEIAWHGIVYRGENDDYFVKDILVYPQLVSGANVEGDKEKMFEWLAALDDDSYANMKMQGHSHVNMGVTPSATDLTLYKDEILSELSEDSFYVFVIWNKKGDKTIKIYDYGKNIFFDTSDVNVKINNDGLGVEDLIADAKEKLKPRVYTPTATAQTVNTPAATKGSANTNVKQQETKKYTRKEPEKKSSYNGNYYGGYGCGYYGYGYSSYADEDDDYNPDYAYHRKGW